LDNAGLTSATPSQVAFSLRKLSSAYTGFAIKVRRSSDNAEANIAFDGSGGVSASSLVTFTPGVAVGSSFGTAQAGTIVCDVSKTGSITIKANKTGTITTSNGSLIVTGSSTSFTSELVVGDRLFNGANNIFLGVVASISSNTSLLLTNYSTVSVGAVSYKNTNATVTGTGTNFTGQLSPGDRIFNSANSYLGTVTSISNATSLTLNAVDAVSATAISFKGSSATVTGTGTSFTSLTPGDLLISNNITLGIISSVANATSLTLTTKAGASVSGLAFKLATGTVPFNTFYASASVYVNTFYDQSGNGRDALQPKPGNQARIVNAGTLYLVNGRTSMEFSNSLTAFLQTSTVASYLNNTLYTLNKVTAEATINPALQLPISTTGGNGPNNTISHYGYRSSSQFTVAQYGNDQNFNSTPSTSLEIHTSVKISTASSQFYKNGISLGVLTSGAPSNLNTVGLLNIGYYTPTNSYYNGSVSELSVFSSALTSADITLLNNNQLAYYSIATTYWTGAVSTDWNNTGNWSTGVLPTLSNPSIVVIPAGKPRYPLVSATSQANSISLEAGTTLTVTGTLQLAGTLNNLGTCTASAGTIQYIGPAPQSIVANTFAGNAIQNMIVNNGTGVTLNGSITVSGNLAFTTGYLSMATGTLTIGGTVTNTVAGGLNGGPYCSLIVNTATSPTLSFDQTTPGTSNALKNFTINSSGQIITLANNLLLYGTGTTTFTAGKLAIGNTTLTMRGGIVNTVTGGLRGSTSGNVIVDGIVSPVLSFDQTTPGTTNALNSLTLNCSGQTATLNTSLAIISALNLTAGTLADGGNQLTSTSTINLTGGTFKLGSASVATVWPAFTTNNITSGTAEYASGVPQTVSAVPIYQHLTISATGGTTAAGNITVNGILNLSAANPSATTGSFSMSTYTLNMGASATTIGQGDVTGIVKRTTILPNISYTMGNEFSSITFPNTGTLPSQMSMRISIGVAPSWQAGAVKRTYDFIQTGGANTKAVISAHYLDAELNGNIENKLVDFSYRFAGGILTEHGKSNFNTTQNWIVLSNVNVAFFSSSFGNLELSFDESALTILTWNGSTSTSWITATNWTPNGGPSTNTVLIIPDASTTPNDPYLPATASNGSVTIESGGILNSDPGAQLTLNNSGLAWSNNGSFNAGSSAVIFTNPNATINGVTNFNDVIINSGAALLLSTGTIMRIGGTITNNGIWSAGLLPNTVEYNGNNQTVLIPNGTTQSYQSLIISGTGTTVLPAGIVSILNDLTINGAISTSGNTIAMNGEDPLQNISGSSPITLNNLVANNAPGTVNLNQQVSIAGTLTLSAGKLGIGSNTLTLSGNVINTIPNGITGSAASNLIINGAVSPTLSFDQTIPGVSNSLNNLTINSGGQVPLLGSDLEIDGTMTFTGGKLAINGNTLTLEGAIVNTVSGGLRGSSTSNLIVSGGTASPGLSFDQTTNGTTNLLNNLSMNSAGQTTTLLNPLVVGGSLNLQDGLVTTTAANSLTLGAAASFTGGSDLSFVNGPLLRNTGAIADHIFPVGKSGSYRPVTVSPDVATAGVYSAEYFPAAPFAGSNGLGLSAITTNEYWNISRLSGPTARITLNYTSVNTWSPGSPTSLDNIFVAQLNGSTWDPAYGSTIAGNTGTGITPVVSKLLTSFSSFTFGFGPFAALPVHLINFSAVAVDQSVNLVWTVADEASFDRYDLERSADGRSFYVIGSVPSTNTPFQKTYRWVDNTPLPGTSFYRLKMIDLDGQFKYSMVVKISMNLEREISIYPNPVTGNTIMLQMYDQPKGNYAINMYSLSGQLVMINKIIHDGNNTSRSLELPTNLPKGCYYLRVSNPQGYQTGLKVIIN